MESKAETKIAKNVKKGIDKFKRLQKEGCGIKKACQDGRNMINYGCQIAYLLVEKII